MRLFLFIVALVLIRYAWACSKRVYRVAVGCWSQGLSGKVRVAVGATVAIAGVVSVSMADLSQPSLVTLASIFVIALSVIEYNCKPLDAARQEELTRERRLEASKAAAARQALLAMGIGWTRFDVLEKHRTTIFFHNANGRVQPTSGWQCSVCRKNLYREEDATIDHIKPRSKHPHLYDVESNLQILCNNCNSTKSAYDGDDWKAVTRKRRRALNKRRKIEQ